MFKFYASNPNSGFTKLRKIRKKDREPYAFYDNELNTMIALYSSFTCFFLFGFLSSIILFRQQRTLALKKIVIIENIDYDCIELQCHVSNVCTEKELMLIQRAVKLENEYRKQTTLGIIKGKNRIKH
uniref:Uncharacterized protein n=1 Tax=Strongyloides papillosus TaxID=174720 RepID=A0A0N5C4Z7_STREA